MTVTGRLTKLAREQIDRAVHWVNGLTHLPCAYVWAQEDGAETASWPVQPVGHHPLYALVAADVAEARMIDELSRAGRDAVKRGEPIFADSLLGPATIWACPCFSHFAGAEPIAGALTAYLHTGAALMPVAELADRLGCPPEEVLSAVEQCFALGLTDEQAAATRASVQALCAALDQRLEESLSDDCEGNGSKDAPATPSTGALRSPEKRLQSRETTLRLQELGMRLAAENEGLREALRARSLLMAHMSHELRTPLNGIIGLTELVRDGAFGPVTEEQSRYLATVESNGAHLVRLIDDLLDIATIETGRFTIRPEPCAVSQVLADAAQTLQPMALSRRITLSVTLPPDDTIVVIDAERLRQIAVNLISNAVKFSPRGRSVEVRARLDGPDLVFSVRDWGPGVPAAEQDVIFEEFRKGSAQSDGKYEGTGLGLPLVRRLTGAMGGTIELHSEEGHGAEFVVRLPASGTPAGRSSEPVEPGPKPAATTGGEGTVLIAEEDEASREVLAEVVSAEGLRPVTLASPDDLPRLTRELRPALLLVGQARGGPSVVAGLRNLRQDPELVDVPVVFAGPRGLREQAMQIGVTETCAYPVRRPYLGRLINRILARSAVTGLALVMDDNPAFSEAMAILIETAGLHALSVSDGRTGLEMALRHLPDVIILDLMLPRMNGWQVIDALNADERTRDIPVIVSTVKPLTETERSQLEQKCHALLPKAHFSSDTFLSLLGGLPAGRDARGD